MSDQPKPAGAAAVAVAAAKEYADLILKEPLGELGGMLSDALGQWRLRNQVRLLLKTKAWLEEKGVSPQAIKPEMFVPLVTQASMVEDESLADMFASLLATSLDPQTSEDSHPSYATVLGQISPTDARVLVRYSQMVSYQGAREMGLVGGGLIVHVLASEMGLSPRATFLSSLNLLRLGLVERAGYEAPIDHPTPLLFENDPQHQRYRMTEYGIAFCQACNYQGEHRHTR